MKFLACAIVLSYAGVEVCAAQGLAVATPAPASTEPAAVTASKPRVPDEKDLELSLDATVKVLQVPPGDSECTFVFRVTNTGKSSATIYDVKTSCGCTTAKLPRRPWTLATGETVDLPLVVTFPGKSGVLVKSASIETDRGYCDLTMQVRIPEPDNRAARDRNRMLASKNRQEVFRGDCAGCHATPTAGLKGEELYHAACGICHDGEHRATMVPDLRHLPRDTDRGYWVRITEAGKPGTLMPGFSRDIGGPLSKAQIESLANYLAATILPAAGAETKH